MGSDGGSNVTANLSHARVLLDAIELTLGTFEARTRLYRNLVVVVSLSLLASIAGTLIWWLLPLIGLTLLALSVRVYVHLDARLVARWNKDIRSMRTERGLDLMSFRGTVEQMKHLPQRSLQLMFQSLLDPSGGTPKGP